MAKLSKEKRDQIILIGLGTGITLALIWYFLISSQLEANRNLETKISDTQKKVETAKNLISKKATFETELEGLGKVLVQIEKAMVSGDPRAWMNRTLGEFGAGYQVDIPQIASPTIKPLELLPQFPYEAAVFRIQGEAYYHDLGEFVADFENRFPYKQLRNLALTPSPAKGETTTELLQFEMEIVALMKPAGRPQ